MYKRWLMMVSLIALLLLSACQKEPKGIPLEVPAGMQQVTDYLGRQVNVPLKVDRIGCLYAVSGHAVTMLGKGENIVAVVEGLKREVVLREINPTISQAGTPKTGEAINIEELSRLAPDVIFIQNSTGRNEAEMEKLAKFKLPALVVDYKNMAEQQAAITMIGQAIGAPEKAAEYNAYYQATIDRVVKITQEIPAEKRVSVYHSVNEATRTDAKDTLPADWLKAVGVINVSLDQNLRVSGDKYFASIEQILLWDADVILVNEEGVDEYILSNEHWRNLKAVKDKKVYKMPNGISRWGHPGSMETPLAILWTAQTIYPEYFSDVDMVKETQDFYARFFNHTITSETAKQILQGVGMREAKDK